MAQDSELITLRFNTEEEYDHLSMPIPSNEENSTNPINWINKIEQGDFMPAVLMLERQLIKINDEIYPQSGITMLHIAINYGFYNVIRTFIEIYKADVNAINFSGHTPLHLLTCQNEQNIYILSYLLKIPHININIRDSSYLTPVFYSIINHFYYAFLSFMHLSPQFDQCDSQQNKLLYFAIVNNNKFATDYILHNTVPGKTIKEILNVKYYNETSTLSDVIITNKNNEVTNHLVKNYYNDIDLDSISSCKRNKLSFPFYNVFTYELLNTVYFYKCGHYMRFIKALIFNYKPTYNVSNYDLHTKSESNGNMCYHYKAYMLYFMVYHLIIPNMNQVTRIIFFCLSLIFVLILTVILFDSVNHGTIFLYILTFSLYAILFMKNNMKSVVIEKQAPNSLSKDINDDMTDNVFHLPSIEEVCAVCSIRKGIKDNHCYKCNCCIIDFYFHSNIFNVCIHRRNVRWYIMFLLSLMMLFFNIVFIGEYDKLNSSKHVFIVKLIMIVINGGYKKILFKVIASGIGMIFLGKIIALVICLGTNVPYHNMFRYHQGGYGEFQYKRNKGYVQTPQEYFVSWNSFIKNIIC